MGGNMAERLMRRDTSSSCSTARPTSRQVQLGATSAGDLAKVVQSLRAPRIIWIMVPAGIGGSTITRRYPQCCRPATQSSTAAAELSRHHPRGSSSRNRRSADRLRHERRHLGLENSCCLMVGGSDTAVKHCEPIFTSLAPETTTLTSGRPGQPLRENGAQRHRVWSAASVRRGI